jgi:hypothetical protein
MYKNDDISVGRGTPFSKERKERKEKKEKEPKRKKRKERKERKPFCGIGKTIISTY